MAADKPNGSLAPDPSNREERPRFAAYDERGRRVVAGDLYRCLRALDQLAYTCNFPFLARWDQDRQRYLRVKNG